MKKILLIICLMVSLPSFSQTEKSRKDTFPLEQVIKVINNSLVKATDSIGSKLKGAKITLATTYDKSGGGGLKFFVKAGKEWENTKTISMSFEFEKPKKTIQLVESINKSGDFEENLFNAIIDASNQWQNISNFVTGLDKKEFTVEISFIAKSKTTGGIEFEIWGIGVDGAATYEKTLGHTISLTFEK
jgi:hypothetical protein